MTSGPNYNEDPDTEGATVPPYEGRQKTADVDGPDEETKDGANTGGATGPVESAGDADPGTGGDASPADEQPASEMPETDTDDDATGPAHETGTGRAEDKP
ncbi:hypothetical protein [Nocardioides sp.]|uniref:hypothetical protein n=1 Tax=Nocardioides sp. TaxID=35761 RepID=UPI0031FE9B59|nr:hypothetical protein [Nocardioides sp.]